AYAALDGLLEVGVIQNDVGRFAAEFEGDSFDRFCRQLADTLAGPRRAGEGNHIDVRMRRYRFSNDRAVTRNQIEDACRQSYIVANFREDESGERRDFARLQNDRAAGGQGGRDFTDHLMQREVPRRDAADYSHRLFDDKGVGDLLFKLEIP